MHGSEKNNVLIYSWNLRCARCGTCINYCPTYSATKWEHLSPRGRILLSRLIESDDEVLKSVFSCLTCGICEEVCPSNAKIVDLMERTREKFIEKGLVPENLKKLFDNMEKFGNPYGIENEAFEINGRAEIVYYPGCTSLLKERNIFESSVKILEKMGVDFAIESKFCCGSTVLRTGGSKSFAKRNFERLKEVIERTGAKKIIVSCPGCYRTIARDYKEFGDLNVEVQHIVEFVAERIDELNLKKEGIKLTLHDSCHLARHMNVVEEPRIILKRIGELVEPENHGKKAICCGGGGGVKINYREISNSVNRLRADELKKTNADLVVTTCPFCYRNLKTCEGLNIKDITVLIAERLR